MPNTCVSVHLLVALLYVGTLNCGLNLRELESSLVNAGLLWVLLDLTCAQKFARAKLAIVDPIKA